MSKTITELEAQAKATIEDNTTGAISAADVRNMVLDFLDAVKPATALMRISSPLTKALTATPQVLAPFSVTDYADSPDFVANMTNGSITRIKGTSTKIRTRILALGVVEAPSGTDVTIEVRRNNVAVGSAVVLTGRGTGNFESFNFTNYGPESTNDGKYEIYVSTKVNANVVFSNVSLLIEKIPVR